MHQFREFIETEMAARQWARPELSRRSGLSRSHVHKLLKDERDHLGQMPDEVTLEALAKAFGVPVERVRQAASRALVGYKDGGEPLTVDLKDVSDDALIEELRRRVKRESKGTQDPQGTTTTDGETGDHGTSMKSETDSLPHWGIEQRSGTIESPSESVGKSQEEIVGKHLDDYTDEERASGGEIWPLYHEEKPAHVHGDRQ